MFHMSGRRIFLLAVGGYVAYLFYVPVPSDINEPQKYRAVVAFQKFLLNMVAIRSLFDDSPATRVRRFRDSLTALRMFLPSGTSYATEVKLTKVIADGVKVHIYQPPGSEDEPPLPGFIYIHGGGLALFDAEHYDGLTRKLSANLNAVVMSIDYQRPPDCVFPIPFEESLKATKWFMRRSKEYNVDVNRIGIGGDSAGGYLSATVSQAITDDKSIPDLKLQILIYPWLQILDLNTPSYQKYEHDSAREGSC
ncbi:putative neutral cholesterol ester hydrolase 1 [Apostichopus japonicus]|uniref:Putative neutral cholesterol ester hydrolase 1 n=1 Tax=Stichopus japonicus TaxID=307972 RepID=A0A2G8JTC7_STIJA|nr:putative neutral cholesterol ester hydrolase 1 [Apostichopus japonicus]